jgi:tRNA-2-methylthio-N6-dimethylallyladenosine synthase
VLVENVSKKSDEEYSGRTSQNNMVIFPKKGAELGAYITVKITRCTSATLFGEIVR